MDRPARTLAVRRHGRLSGRAQAAICIVAAGLVVVGPGRVIYRAHARSRQERAFALCYENVKHLCLAMDLYTEDHAGHLPPSPRWVELTKPYLPAGHGYVCRAAPKLDVGYAYADYLGGVEPARAKYARDVYMLWDARPPSPWPAFRHGPGANVGFLDGHVKWIGAAGPFLRLVEVNRALLAGQLPPPQEPAGRPASSAGVH